MSNCEQATSDMSFIIRRGLSTVVPPKVCLIIA